MQVDITWTLHVETSNGTETITASSKSSETPTLEDGTEIEDVTLHFFDHDGGREDYRDRYRSLWPFLDAPKAAVDRRGVDDFGRPWFRERYAVDYPVESLLIGVEPGIDTIDQRGWWGLLVSADDTSEPVDTTGDLRVVETTWFVLSRFGEFETHDDVRDAFADGVI